MYVKWELKEKPTPVPVRLYTATVNKDGREGALILDIGLI
jgi:hypothetical protein